MSASLRVLPLLFAAIAFGQATPAPIPEGVNFTIRMDTILDAKQTKVDDEFTATVSKDAKAKGGQVVIPKKSVVRGHVRIMKAGVGAVVVGLEIEEIQVGDVKTPVRAALQDMLTPLPGTSRYTYPSSTRSAGTATENGSADSSIVGGSSSIVPNNTPGVGTFQVNESGFKLRNLEMVWRTLPPATK